MESATDYERAVGVYVYRGSETSGEPSTAAAAPPRQTDLAVRLRHIAHVLSTFCMEENADFAIRSEQPGVVAIATRKPSTACMLGRSTRTENRQSCDGGFMYCPNGSACTLCLPLEVCSFAGAITK